MKYIWHEGQWCEAVRAPPRKRLAIITDGMGPLMHPVTGKVMDSKAAFRAATRAAGYEEVGNEIAAHLAPPRAAPGDVKADVKRAIDMVEQGHVAAPIETAEAETRIYE